MLRFVSALLLLSASAFAPAYSVSIEQTVDSRDNLYYTDWGHWFTTAADNALGNPDSNPASSVAQNGTPFNFADFTTLSINASGSVIDHFGTATGPDGDTCTPNCLFNDGYFRKLPAYSLIGIWSSSATEIVPFGDWKDLTSGLGLLFIGSHLDLTIPSFPSAYLFLAENDGGFADNFGKYTVQLVASVPEPGSLALLVVGFAMLIVTRRRVK
ncbi:MAG: hypothetical protein JWM78_861 [Verrucomicrobiaceae bacterium]|nr:hypothetical protein [Verrucomicrobiaceae bacterium]